VLCADELSARSMGLDRKTVTQPLRQHEPLLDCMARYRDWRGKPFLLDFQIRDERFDDLLLVDSMA
jgi:hypothetical protein